MRTLDRRELIQLADRYLNDCLGCESPPHVNELAARIELPRSELSKLFVRLVGEQPRAYLRLGQIEYAKRLLRDTNLPMNVIAYRGGFGTRTTFFRAFKRIVGMTPLQYREAA